MPEDQPYSAEYIFRFKPSTKFGACYTAVNGGYVNMGRFKSQINTDSCSPISLSVVRDDEPGEVYRFYYFLVEVIAQD